MTSKCGKNKEVAHERQVSVSLMFVPHSDVFCDLLLRIYFSFVLLLFSFSYLYTVSSKRFLKVCSCSKQNNGESILQNSESPGVMIHDGNCCDDFLQFWYS